MVLIDESPLSWILKSTSWWDHVLEKATYPVNQKTKRKMSWVALIPPRGVPPVIQHLHKLLLYIVPKPPRCFTISTKLLELWEKRLLYTMRFRWAAITILRHFHQLQEKTCTFEQCPPRPQYLSILPTPLRNAYSSSWL